MTLEQLYSEAFRQGYRLVPKRKGIGRLNKHCGAYPKRTADWHGYGWTVTITCPVCGKEHKHTYRCPLTKADAMYRTGGEWNKMLGWRDDVGICGKTDKYRANRTVREEG